MFCFVISKWHILVNSEVLNLKFFFIVSSLSGVRVDSVAHFGLIFEQSNEYKTTNIGLLYPKVRSDIGGLFPLASPNQHIGEVSPASPAGLTPVERTACMQTNTFSRL